MKIRELISEVGAMQQIGSIAKDIGSIGSTIKKDFIARRDAMYNKLGGGGGAEPSGTKFNYKHPLNKIVSGQLLTSSEAKAIEDLILKLETGEIKPTTVAPTAAAMELKDVLKSRPADLDTIKKLIQNI
jgi:hypothetical protein